jgi:hypothetical protein
MNIEEDHGDDFPCAPTETVPFPGEIALSHPRPLSALPDPGAGIEWHHGLESDRERILVTAADVRPLTPLVRRARAVGADRAVAEAAEAADRAHRGRVCMAPTGFDAIDEALKLDAERVRDLEAERDALSLRVVRAEDFASHAQESERRARNEAREMAENLTAVQSRCTELLETLRASRAIESLATRGATTVEPILWQLVRLGAAMQRAKDAGRSPTFDDLIGSVGLMALARGTVSESKLQEMAYEVAVIAMSMHAGEQA